MDRKLSVLDTTLRDGAQCEGVSFSLQDKINIVTALDRLGIACIEAGNPFSNPKDSEFFSLMKNVGLNNSVLYSFGSTRRKECRINEDKNVQTLLETGTEGIVIFGKSWDFHVTEILHTSLTENLSMIYDTVKYFKDKGKSVIFDCEHFFDGYLNNTEYAVQTLKTAEQPGADILCLCDTNGGTMTSDVHAITREVCREMGTVIGIHTHNDCGLAVANTLAAIEAGARHLQGTLIGIGERCGNTNLSTAICNLQLKYGYRCIPDENIANMTLTVRQIAEIANVHLPDSMPYVGKSAFTHKAGMHADGVLKDSKSFEHIGPGQVGNSRRFLTSEVAGRSTLVQKIQKLYPAITKESPELDEIMKEIKQLENEGYQFEGASGSFGLLVRRIISGTERKFELVHYKVIEEFNRGEKLSSALIKVRVNGREEIAAAEGRGPVNALDSALRKALETFYPVLRNVHLTDYKVRVLNSKDATAAKVRVLVEFSDGGNYWATVGVSEDVIEASCIALVDSMEYKLFHDQ